MDHLSEMDRIALSTDMQVHHVRRLKQKMVMQGGLLDTSLLQLRDHWIDFVFGQDQISHHHGSVAYRQKDHVASERKRRQQFEALRGHVQICPGEAIAVDATGHGPPCFSHDLVNLFPTDGRALERCDLCRMMDSQHHS